MSEVSQARRDTKIAKGANRSVSGSVRYASRAADRCTRESGTDAAPGISHDGALAQFLDQMRERRPQHRCNGALRTRPDLPEADPPLLSADIDRHVHDRFVSDRSFVFNATAQRIR